jgi:hypothetical protein
MKKLFAFLLLAAGLVSCSSCVKKDQPPVDASVPAPTPSVDAAAPAPVTATFSVDNLSITMPGPGWVPQVLDPHMFKVGGAMPLLNEALQNASILAKEETVASYDEYIIANVRAVKTAGANVHSTKQVVVNGHKFVLIESSRDNLHVWTWVTLEKGFGYNFSCGGPVGKTNQQDLCLGISNTLKIN